MKDLIMKIILIGFVIFLGYTFVNSDDDASLRTSADEILTNANTVLSTVDILEPAHVNPGE